MFNWLKSLIKSIGRFLKKIWDKIRPFLAIIALVALVMAPVLAPWLATIAFPSFLSWVPALFAAVGSSWWVSALVGLGVGAALDSGAVTHLANGVIGTVGDIASTAVSAAVDVASTAASAITSSLLSSPLFWLIGGVAVLYLFSSNDDESDVRQSRTSTSLDNGALRINGS